MAHPQHQRCTKISNDTVFAFNGLKFFKLRTQPSHYAGQFAGKWKALRGSPAGVHHVTSG